MNKYKRSKPQISKRKLSKRKRSKPQISKRKLSKHKRSKPQISKRKLSKHKRSKRKLSKHKRSKRKLSNFIKNIDNKGLYDYYLEYIYDPINVKYEQIKDLTKKYIKKPLSYTFKYKPEIIRRNYIRKFLPYIYFITNYSHGKDQDQIIDDIEQIINSKEYDVNTEKELQKKIIELYDNNELNKKNLNKYFKKIDKKIYREYMSKYR